MENAEDITTPDEVYEHVSDSLLGWQPDTQEEEVRALCDKFLLILHNGKKVQKVVRETGARKLEHTVEISETTTRLNAIDSIWNIQAKDVPTMVSSGGGSAAYFVLLARRTVYFTVF